MEENAEEGSHEVKRREALANERRSHVRHGTHALLHPGALRKQVVIIFHLREEEAERFREGE